MLSMLVPKQDAGIGIKETLIRDQNKLTRDQTTFNLASKINL